jgi:hypothetical protein
MQHGRLTRPLPSALLLILGLLVVTGELSAVAASSKKFNIVMILVVCRTEKSFYLL